MIKRPLVPTLGAVAGGLVTNLAFPYHSWWWAAPVGVALLLVSLRGARTGRALWLGFAWGLAFFLPLLSWALNSVGQALPWIALSVSQAAFIAVFAALYAASSRKLGAHVVPAVILWVAIEQLRGVVPFGGFPWGNLAFSQTDGPLLDLAPYGGTVLVSATVVLLAAGAVTLLRRPARGVAALAAAGVVVVAGLVYQEPLGAQDGTVTVGVVQGSVPVRGAEALGQSKEITANYSAIVTSQDWDVDFMVWPESAADTDPRSDADVRASVMAAQAAIDAPLLLGTQRYDDDVRYNEYILWTDQGASAAYAKQHPVPFGEYIPYREFFRKLSSAVDLVTVDMAQGTQPAVMDVPIDGAAGERTVRLGSAICFEVAYDALVRESVDLGAELLVVPTNNASFGFAQEATQQYAISRFRAAEHARATIQVSTVGVSGVFAPDGSVIAQSGELYTQWSTQVELPLRTSLTLSDRMGDAPQYVFWALGGIWALALIGRKERR